jgi:DNA-directed RNA polymerase specialized sigma subunit
LTSPHRTEHPYVVLVAHDLALRHQDLEQSAMVGFILAARRYAPERGGFRPFARNMPTGRCVTSSGIGAF